jgi:hypothetical protein
MTATAPPPPVSRIPRGQLLGTVGVITVLTGVAVVVGARPWALPERVLGGWQVAAVPGSLIALLAVSTVVCLVVATALTMRGERLRPSRPAGVAWLAIVVVAAGALVFNALVLAADASYVVGAIIPVLHWLFTLVPALLAGAVSARRGAAAAAIAALGTGVVTVPLFALGWALFASREPFVGAVAWSLQLTAILGALPLLVAVGLARGWGRTREWRAAASHRAG